MKVLVIEELFKHRVSNVVFMGMGEPMLNLKSVLEAHRCLNKVILIFSLSLWFETLFNLDANVIFPNKDHKTEYFINFHK